MKHQTKILSLFIIFHFSFFFVPCSAQVNLIPDPSFEDTISQNIYVPINYNLKQWKSLDSTRPYVCESIYWNTGNYNINSSLYLPYNSFFYQFPHSGNGIIDILTYNPPSLYPPPFPLLSVL